MLLTARRPPAPLVPPVPAPPAALPDRPCLTLGREPVSRAGDAVQFGVDPPHALVLDGLTPPLVRMVTGLDGSRRVAEVVADAVAAGACAAAAHAVLHRLGAAGVLGSCSAAGAHHPEVRVHGGGRVAVALACLLAASRACRVAVDATGAVDPDDVGTGLAVGDVGRARVQAVSDAIARATGPVADRAPGPPRPAPDLVVLADGPVPDPTRLGAGAGAHLAVAVRGGIGIVGPLVLPGRTPCLGCDERARAEADPAWPALAAQLGRCRPAVPPALAYATAALAAEQVLAVLRTGAPAPPVLGAVLELDPRAGSLRRRTRLRHPGCGCARADRVGATTAA